MTILSDITRDREQARKTHDEKRLSTLQLALSALKNEQISLGHELSKEEGEQVLARQVKQLRESIIDFQAGGRQDLVDAAQAEITCLQAYLPEPLSDDELRVIVKDVIAAVGGGADVGKIMGAVMKEVKGRADGARVRAVVSATLG